MNAPVQSETLIADVGTKVFGPRIGGRWKADQVDTLKRMWAEGASLRAIAAATGMCLEQVRAKRYSLGLAPRCKGMTVDDKWPEHKKATLRREYLVGTSYGRIAEMVGKTVQQVKKQREAMGLAARQGISGGHVTIKLYCSKDEASRLGRRAMVKGVSCSAYLRRLVLKELQ